MKEQGENGDNEGYLIILAVILGLIFEILTVKYTLFMQTLYFTVIIIIVHKSQSKHKKH